MVGGGFQHAYSSCGWNYPKYIVWDKTTHSSPTSIHIDADVFNIKPDKSKLNIAWFSESPYFMRPYTNKFDISSVKDWALNTYKWIFSSDKELLKKHPEFKYIIPHAHPWIQNRKIFSKTKNISIIASAKRESPGHILRHIVVDTYKNVIDAFGGGYKPIKDKEEGLSDYYFSFAIENIKTDGYFTEKITDCFATGTIPIYWGDETISDHFFEEGIIRLDDNFDPPSLTKELYDSKINFIIKNFEKSCSLPLPEDYIYINFIK